MKQKKPIRKQCEKRSTGKLGRCINDATIGIYKWSPGDSDVNLDTPVMVVCGDHKMHFDYRSGQYFRNVNLRRT